MADARLKDSHQDSHQGSTYRRIELITGEAKRRLWTAEEKAGILSESFRPGAKVAEVARRHGVSRSLLWNWRHEARKRGMVAERAFVPVRVAEEATTLRPPMAMEQCAGSASAAASWMVRRRDRRPARSILNWVEHACGSAVRLVAAR